MVQKVEAKDWSLKCWLHVTDEKILKERLDEMLKQAGFGVRQFIEERFEPQGYSALWLLSESHLAIHTHPERGGTSLELSSCVEEYYDNFVDLLTESSMSHQEVLEVYSDLDEGYWTIDIAPKNDKAWGFMTSIRIDGCDHTLITDKKHVANYTDELCRLIDMKKYGKPQIPNFGEDPRVAGFSLNQFIETSNITGHFRNETNQIYMDIFSCKTFDPIKAMEFTKNWFNGKSASFFCTLR